MYHRCPAPVGDEVAQIQLHPGTVGLAPVAFERPPVELGDRHEGDHQEPAGQVQAISLGARIVFEEVRRHVPSTAEWGGRASAGTEKWRYYMEELTQDGYRGSRFPWASS